MAHIDNWYTKYTYDIYKNIILFYTYLPDTKAIEGNIISTTQINIEADFSQYMISIFNGEIII